MKAAEVLRLLKISRPTLYKYCNIIFYLNFLSIDDYL